ncbi:MAG: DUF4956 domain-containing protein [bacterium]|nr:DUF4956 domain-containing protein [bacterium]
MVDALGGIMVFSEPWSLGDVILNSFVAFLLGLFITWVYRGTHREMGTSFSFVNTLVLLSMLMSLVVMVIGNNIARAFGLAGAMSIIRFRTAVKDTRDTAFVFYALGAGMAAGTGNLMLAVVGSTLVGFFIGLLHWAKHGTSEADQYMLSFLMLPADDETGNLIYLPHLESYCRHWKLISLKSERMGEFVKLSLLVSMKKPGQSQSLINALSNVDGIHRVSMVLGEQADVDFPS